MSRPSPRKQAPAPPRAGAAAAPMQITASQLQDTVGVGDMVLLDPITEENLVQNLKARFGTNQIYTYIGSVVVSVNPYQPLPIYTPDYVFHYTGRNLYELKPHIYALADDAYRSMRDKNKDQCVIITGESGAGKTEASKVIMQYIAAVSGKGTEVDKVKNMLLHCNPVLEGFGNARTNRNDNSSRFGKYMDMQFNYEGDPIGGVITDYLLEKSRVVHQAQGERNFHIFYQLLRGADDAMLKSLRLTRNASDYFFLSQSGVDRIETIDDKADWSEVIEGCRIIGLDDGEREDILQLLAAILHLGNLQFEGFHTQQGINASKLLSSPALTATCQVLGCQAAQLETVLTQRVLSTGIERVVKPLQVSEAQSARDALSKAIYSRLFTWLVQRINECIEVKNKKAKRRTIGVLDIYGFEIFQDNSFEQFIINYCNEKLQQVFIELTLKSEQDEYVREGIEWTHIDFFNNAVICELIEGKNGLLAVLDDACLRPGQIDDPALLHTYNQTRAIHSHLHYESRTQKKFLSDTTMSQTSFRLRHYAGNVTYRIDGFLDKNRDLLFQDLAQFMYTCKHSLAKTLFREGRVLGSGPSTQKRPPTLAFQFKASVGDLMKSMLAKNPHYIRCIKPNDAKRKSHFDESLVLHQVRYLGLMENVRVRRAGYAFRMEFDRFLERYKMLSKLTWPKYRGSPRDGVKHILEDLDVEKSEYSWGRSKVFIRNPKSLFLLEDKRRAATIVLAIKIQSMIRGWMKRTLFKKMRKAQITLSSNYRGFVARRAYKKQRAAQIVVASYIRMWLERRKFKAYKRNKALAKASIVIAAYVRGWLVRRKYRKHFRVNAGPVLLRNLLLFQKKAWLRRLAGNLPTKSPMEKASIAAPPPLRTAAQLLQSLYHDWRCLKYRENCNEAMQGVLREKHIASQLFKGKKITYPASVALPFLGDRLSIKSHERWPALLAELDLSPTIDPLVAVDVSKFNRSNGAPSERVLVVLPNGIVVCDKKLRVKQFMDFGDLRGISVSSQNDFTVVLHVGFDPDKPKSKGDVILLAEEVIEVVTRTFIAHRKATNKELPVSVADTFEVTMDRKGPLDVKFDRGQLNELALRKKGRQLVVQIPDADFAANDDEGMRRRGGSVRRRFTSLWSEGDLRRIKSSSGAIAPVPEEPLPEAGPVARPGILYEYATGDAGAPQRPKVSPRALRSESAPPSGGPAPSHTQAPPAMRTAAAAAAPLPAAHAPHANGTRAAPAPQASQQPVQARPQPQAHSAPRQQQQPPQQQQQHPHQQQHQQQQHHPHQQQPRAAVVAAASPALYDSTDMSTPLSDRPGSHRRAPGAPPGESPMFNGSPAVRGRGAPARGAGPPRGRGGGPPRGRGGPPHHGGSSGGLAHGEAPANPFGGADDDHHHGNGVAARGRGAAPRGGPAGRGGPPPRGGGPPRGGPAMRGRGGPPMRGRGGHGGGLAAAAAEPDEAFGFD